MIDNSIHTPKTAAYGAYGESEPILPTEKVEAIEKKSRADPVDHTVPTVLTILALESSSALCTKSATYLPMVPASSLVTNPSM